MDFLINLFIIFPFVVNAISLVAGVLLWLWLIKQRKKYDVKHNETNQ